MPRTENTTQELLDLMSAFINSFTPEYKEFIEGMNREHRTLQQSFTKLCLMWIENCASEDYRFDLRNQDSHTISETILETFAKAMKLDATKPSEWLPCV